MSDDHPPCDTAVLEVEASLPSESSSAQQRPAEEEEAQSPQAEATRTPEEEEEENIEESSPPEVDENVEPEEGEVVPEPPQEEEVEEAVDDAMQIEPVATEHQASGDEEESEEQEEDAKRRQEMAYSTRGRSAELHTADDPLERLAREALGDAAAAREQAAARSSSQPRESFLSDSLTEEERRTRTRYIPSVEGMNALRKHEIKSDVALARTNFTSAGVAGTVAMAKAKSKQQREGMEGGDEGVASMDEERASDIMRIGTKTVEIGPTDLVVPSTAFVPPPEAAKTTKSAPSPRHVEAVTAFNPPRPPESIGAKKKHRMLRWERRPADIDVDLNNYRKTVQRTREELKDAQAELKRIGTVDYVLRKNFFNHLHCLADEWNQLNEELAAVQQECVSGADLLTSRTRSRGAGKSAYAMRDVLTVLRARGQEIEARGLKQQIASSESLPSSESAGAGGVGVRSFVDWDRSTILSHPGSLATEWLLPGDSVQTPYGKGSVVAVLGPSQLDMNEPPHKDLLFQPVGKEENKYLFSQPAGEENKSSDSMDVDKDDGKLPSSDAPANQTELGQELGGGPSAAESKLSDGKSGQKKALLKANTNELPTSGFCAPRVAVRLSFGVGFFPIESVVSLEDPSTYSDARLALRWKGMAETGVTVGATVDIEAISDLTQHESLAELNAMDLEEGAADKSKAAAQKDKQRLLPLGAGMLPTTDGRGATLWDMDLNKLDKEINTMFRGGGVLGFRENPGVTSEIRKHEDNRQESLDLQAKVLQLKNQLYRQRRVRMLNERTYASTQERAARVETLVSEMRTDLKSLKRRLDEDISELGLSEEQAEGILTSFYKSLDSKHSGEATPPKKHRRHSLPLADFDEDMDDEEDEDEEGVDEQIDTTMEPSAVE